MLIFSLFIECLCYNDVRCLIFKCSLTQQVNMRHLVAAIFLLSKLPLMNIASLRYEFWIVILSNKLQSIFTVTKKEQKLMREQEGNIHTPLLHFPLNLDP